MEIALYIRKEYFRGVTLTDKSAHILEFHYEGAHVDVFENGGLVFRFRYVLETKFKANIVEFYIPDMTDAFFFTCEPAPLGFGGAEVSSHLEIEAYVTPTGKIGWATAVKPTTAAA